MSFLSSEECERVEARTFVENEWDSGETRTSQSYHQYLWLAGSRLVQRSWFEYPPEVGGGMVSAILDVEEQFYLDLYLPIEDGFRRLQTSWMVHAQEDNPEDFTLHLMISLLEQDSEALDSYLSSHD